jgi:hypothetical protein
MNNRSLPLLEEKQGGKQNYYTDSACTLTPTTSPQNSSFDM